MAVRPDGRRLVFPVSWVTENAPSQECQDIFAEEQRIEGDGADVYRGMSVEEMAEWTARAGL